jgi:hypothetical protein
MFGHCELGFPTGRDSATFRDKGTEVPSLSRDKTDNGTSSKSCQGTGRDAGWDVPDFDSLSCLVPRDKTGQSRKGYSKTGKGRSKTEKDVLKQENDILKQEIWSFFLKIF